MAVGSGLTDRRNGLSNVAVQLYYGSQINPRGRIQDALSFQHASESSSDSAADKHTPAGANREQFWAHNRETIMISMVVAPEWWS